MKPRIAIVHDRLDVVGGAEKVILTLTSMYPEAHVYTSFVDHSKLSPEFKDMDIRTSYMQNLPKKLLQKSDKLLPFYMFAFQDFDLSKYDIVISSSYVAAKSVITGTETCHICYCHTPMRFAWDFYPEHMVGYRNPILKWGLRALLQYFRMWDVQTSNNVDYFVANSEKVRRRINKHYRRHAAVIYPPVQTQKYSQAMNRHRRSEDYYVCVSRLVPYKRTDLVIKAFNIMPDKKLIVIGSGREEKKLRSLAGPNVTMLGWQPDSAVIDYLQRAKALIFAADEDFGILPVEAQAAGLPVIALGRGGALETVDEDRTGIFFKDQAPESIRDAVNRFETMTFDPDEISAHAALFDEEKFRGSLQKHVAMCYSEFKRGLDIRENLPVLDEGAVVHYRV